MFGEQMKLGHEGPYGPQRGAWALSPGPWGAMEGFRARQGVVSGCVWRVDGKGWD